MEISTSVGLSVFGEQFAFEFSGGFNEEGKGTTIMYIRPLREFTSGMYIHMDKEAAELIYENLGKVLNDIGRTTTVLTNGYDTIIQPLYGGLNDTNDRANPNPVSDEGSESESGPVPESETQD